MRFDTFGEYDRLAEKVIDKLSENIANHHVQGNRQDMGLKIVFQTAGHG